MLTTPSMWLESLSKELDEKFGFLRFPADTRFYVNNHHTPVIEIRWPGCMATLNSTSNGYTASVHTTSRGWSLPNNRHFKGDTAQEAVDALVNWYNDNMPEDKRPYIEPCCGDCGYPKSFHEGEDQGCKPNEPNGGYVEKDA